MRKREDSSGAAADVAVVGGGVVGLSIARELARRKLRVTVIERGAPGQEASSAAAGMLAPQAEANRRDSFFELLCASRALYPRFAAELLEESGIDIELDRTGTLYLALNEEDEEEIERRYIWQHRAGLAVERLTPEEARRLEPAISARTRLALRFPGDWQVENRRLCAALAASVASRGVTLLTETEVLGLRLEGGRAAGVETARGFVSAGAVVLAAGAWSSRVPFSTGDVAGGTQQSSATDSEHPRVEPVRGQMLCFKSSTTGAPGLVRHVVYSPRGYVVPRRDGRILSGSTTEDAGFDKRVTASGLHVLAAQALEIVPSIDGLAFQEAWAGLRPRAGDEQPALGASGSCANLFYATGHYRNGILLAPLTGEVLADLIEGVTPAVAPQLLDACSPARFRHTCLASHGE